MYNKYVPLADDLQNILIRQLMSIKPVAEQDIDSMFDEIERIRELYIKAGSDDEPLCEKWFKAAILQNLPDKVVQTLAIELKKAASVEDMQANINTCMFDHKIGMIRGQNGLVLYLTEPDTDSKEDGQELNKVASYKDKLLKQPDEQPGKTAENQKEKEDQEQYNPVKVKVKEKERHAGIVVRRGISSGSARMPKTRNPKIPSQHSKARAKEKERKESMAKAITRAHMERAKAIGTIGITGTDHLERQLERGQ